MLPRPWRLGRSGPECLRSCASPGSPARPLPGSTQSSNKSTTPTAAGVEPRVSTQLRIPWFTSLTTFRFYAVKQTSLGSGLGCLRSCASPGSPAGPLPGSTQSSNQLIKLIAAGRASHQPAHFKVLRRQAISQPHPRRQW